MAKGLVGGKILYSDSTHLKAAHGKKPLKFDGDEVKNRERKRKNTTLTMTVKAATQAEAAMMLRR